MKLKEGGFTLLELLLALLIASFLVLTVTLSLRSYINFSGKAEKKLAEKEKRALFIYTFFKQLQFPEGTSFTRGILFNGERKWLRFTTKIPLTGYYFPGIYGVVYLIDNNTLFEKDAPIVNRDDFDKFVKREPQLEDGNYTPIMEGVSSFSYFDGRRWIDRWVTEGLPKAVRIEMSNGTFISFPVELAKRIL